jgi:hypothetical protein
MFDHVQFGVSDYAASKAFLLKALEPLGVAVSLEGAPTYGVELCPAGGHLSFIDEPDDLASALDTQQYTRLARCWASMARQ